MTVTMERLDLVVRTIARVAVEQEQRFCELDAVAGDGDFGYSLARGFERLLEGADGLDRGAADRYLKGCAMALSGRMGGTSGPIWGTAFLRAALAAGDRSNLTRADVAAMLAAAIEGIRVRGGADLGDKTLLDALLPAVDALTADGRDAQSALAAAATAARHGAEATVGMVARRGRASYAGERSVGSPDPGAVAVAEMFASVADAWRRAEEHG